MKKLRISLVVGFLAEAVCAFMGFLGAVNSDVLADLATIIHRPGMFVAHLVFPNGGRSTIYRDIACVFAVQWAIYTLLVFAVLSLVPRYKSAVAPCPPNDAAV